MNKDTEYYENGVRDLTEMLDAGITDREEHAKAIRHLIHFYTKLGQYEEAKTLLRKHFNFNRKDLLHNIAQVCKGTQDVSFAEELIGEVRCYAYTWLEFCVEMQALYMNLGETEKAEAIQHSIVEVAFMSMRPATRALYQSLEISGHISDSYIIKNLYKEVKRIHKEHT